MRKTLHRKAGSLLVALFAASGAMADNVSPAIAGAASAWWQWLEANPQVPDETGYVDCSIGQKGDTWFLAGSNGQPELIGATRSCTIPLGTTLFFPNVTIGVWYDDGSVSVPAKRAEAEYFISEKPPGQEGFEACGIATTVDGQSGPSAGLQTTRAQTRPFALFGDPEAIADGYWSLYQPTAGRHVIRLQGSICDNITEAAVFEIDMTYVVNVR